MPVLNNVWPENNYPPRTFKTTAAFLRALRDDAILRFGKPLEYNSLTIGFEAGEHLANQLRWGRYQRLSWRSEEQQAMFCLVNPRGMAELWVHRDVRDYADRYRLFLTEVIKVDDAVIGLKGLDVDHLYSRARAREKDTAEYLLLFPTDPSANRSHGYLEFVRANDQRPGKPVSNADFIVFMKIMGWRAPSLKAAAHLDAEAYIDGLRRVGVLGTGEGEYDAVLFRDLVEKIKQASLILQAAKRKARRQK